MATCIDHPACGHELGCCPDFDASGKQLNMVCTCGARLPVNNRYSICDTCLRQDDDYPDFEPTDAFFDHEEEEYHDEYYPIEDQFLDSSYED